MRLLASGRYAILLEHRDRTDAQISLLASLDTFYRVLLQTCIPAAPWHTQYVDPLPKQDHCSAFFHRCAADPNRMCAVVLVPNAWGLTHAVMKTKLAALILRVRSLMYLLFRPLMYLPRLLSCRYVESHRLPLPLSLTCKPGTQCCGIWCCTQGYECSGGQCVYVVSVFGDLSDVSTAHHIWTAFRV